ncbi:MAG: ABC transporter permease subunit [Mariprofundales bacterium]
MKKAPLLWGIHASPGARLNIILAALPFILIITLYLLGSHARLIDNPSDKLMPSITKMIEATKSQIFSENKRTGEIPFIQDNIATLSRLAYGVAIGATLGLFFGLFMGVYPGFYAVSYNFITFISMIPPLAILPIIFIAVGSGEAFKVTLIALGIMPFLALAVCLEVKKIPKEQIIKSLTLGISQIGITFQVILPQIMPRFIDQLRLAISMSWLFLIAAEATSASAGLGYRIYLVKRYLSMDIAIPYILWVSVIAYLTDKLLQLYLQNKYRWYVETR